MFSLERSLLLPAPAGRPDPLIFIATLGLIVIGLVVVFSASYSTGMQYYGDPYFYIKRQLIGAALAGAAMYVLQRADYRLLRPLAVPGLLVSVGLLVLVLLIGIESGGAKRGLNLGFITFQPAEFAKLAMVLFVSAFIAYRRDGIRRFWSGIVPPLAVLGVVFVLILAEPDFGTGMAIAGTVVIMLFTAGASLVQLGALAAAVLPLFGALIYYQPYRWRRISSFLDPWQDPLDSGWNVIQSLLAMGSGGLFGLGLGEGRQKFAYLPEQHTDFIFSVLGEELGLMGTATVVALFFILTWRGLRTAIHAPDLFGSMMAVGLTSMLAFQAFLNIGVATGSLPVTGITLPFVSFGSSSLVVSCAAAGILMSISRSTGGR